MGIIPVPDSQDCHEVTYDDVSLSFAFIFVPNEARHYNFHTLSFF